jgi:hypothetical protein
MVKLLLLVANLLRTLRRGQAFFKGQLFGLISYVFFKARLSPHRSKAILSILKKNVKRGSEEKLL